MERAGVDNYKDALTHVGEAFNTGAGGFSRSERLAVAQVHATLYVGDQIAALVQKVEGVANMLDYIDTKIGRIHQDGLR